MKVLLTTLNSKYVHSNLALKYLYMAGCEAGCQLELREFTINNSRDYIFSELVMGAYDAVCFSCYIWNIQKTLELAEDLKKAKPRLRILVGGPEVSYDSRAFMDNHQFVDFLIAGEGENAFKAWCQAFEKGGSFDGIEGLFFRSNGNIKGDALSRPAEFETLPFPYDAFSCEKDKVIYYESSRGCPFNCSYCISSIDRSVRHLPLSRVKEELSCFLHSKVKQVKFLDRTFNWNRKRSFEIFRYLMEEDRGETNFHFEICADLVDDETLCLLKKARKGLFQFEIGIQSVHEKSLEAVSRSSHISRVLDNVRKLVELGNIHIHTDLIAGLPFEDYDTFGRSFNKVYQLGAENLQLGFLKLLKGTAIRKQADQYEYVFMKEAPYQIISNQFISAEQICRLKQIEEVLDLYHNRGGFESSLKFAVSHMAVSAFAFYENFSDFYYKKGFQHRSHKKEDLYRIFYEFGCSAGAGDTLLELLERDLEQTMNFDAVKKFKRKGWSIL